MLENDFMMPAAFTETADGRCILTGNWNTIIIRQYLDRTLQKYPSLGLARSQFCQIT